MNSPLPPLKTLETEVKAAALSQVNKQENWMKANAKPFIIGCVVGLVLGFLIFHKF